MFRKIIILLGMLMLSGRLAAVPHLATGQAEPLPHKRGAGHHPVTRLSKGMLAASAACEVRALFLRIDFQPVDDPKSLLVTGSGVWSDTAYAHGGDADYWVNRNRERMIAYYDEASLGRLCLQITISPQVYRMPSRMRDYGDESERSLEQLIVDAVSTADDSLDFSQYDALFIIHAGPGEETDIDLDSTRDIWSLYYEDSIINPELTAKQALEVDGITLTHAIIMPQTGSQDGYTIDPLGIYAHEFGHWLGLPDLYPTGFVQDWDAVGLWDLMGSGAYNEANGLTGDSPALPGAWSRIYLGWSDVDDSLVAVDGQSLHLPPLSAAPSVYRFYQDKDSSEQYLLLENRTQSGFDAGLPGSGLVVWRIDESVVTSNLQRNTVNNNPLKLGIQVIEADGDLALMNVDSYDDGSPGDPFPGWTGQTELTPWTLPSSAYEGDSGWLYFNEINQDAVGNINLLVSYSPERPLQTSKGGGCSKVGKIAYSASSTLDFSHYQLYRNGEEHDTTTETEYRIESQWLEDEWSIAAVDFNGYISAPTVLEVKKKSDDCDSRCFIATAAYGPWSFETNLLRVFRDEFLLQLPGGHWLVEQYYQLSPPLAREVAQDDGLQTTVRIILVPVVVVAGLLLWLGLPGVLTLLLMTLAWRRHRRRHYAFIQKQSP